MRRMVITENGVGPLARYRVETSAGTRAVGASLESALSKLDCTDGPNVAPGELHAFARIFRSIRPTKASGQIHEGVDS